MSRFNDYDNDDDTTITYEMWEWNLIQALGSKRGQAALRDLRDALLALPQRKLIARALCTVGDARRPDESISHGYPAREFDELVEEQGYGVCTVGAFVWYQRIKSGADPVEAFASLPTLEDYNHDAWETARAGKQAGLAGVLAEYLAYRNDETWGGLSPADRWQACMTWVESQLSPADQNRTNQ